MTRSLASQAHRANPANPATANCAMWLSPERLAERHAFHLEAGRTLQGEFQCPCGNHTRRMYV